MIPLSHSSGSISAWAFVAPAVYLGYFLFVLIYARAQDRRAKKLGIRWSNAGWVKR
jgi:hypothetical protein